MIIVVRRVVTMRSPVVPQPTDRVGDRILVLDVLLERIRVIEAQMADAAVLGGEPEIQYDRLGMTEMQVAVRFRRETCDDASAVLAAAIVLRDDRPQKICADFFTRSLRAALVVRCRRRERGCLIACMWRCSIHFGLFMNKVPRNPFYPERTIASVCGLRG